jgi:hypothetical protein
MRGCIMRYFPQVTVQIEERVPADVRAALAAKGHALRLEGEWNAVVGAPRRRAARSLSICTALDRHRPSALQANSLRKIIEWIGSSVRGKLTAPVSSRRDAGGPYRPRDRRAQRRRRPAPRRIRDGVVTAWRPHVSSRESLCRIL